MIKRKVWQMYACLETEERDIFPQWIKLYNPDKQQPMKRFLKALNFEFNRFLENPESDPLCEEKNCIENRIWQQVYPKKSFDYAQFLRLSEQLIQWLEKFISVQGIMKDQPMMDLYLLKEIGQRSPTALFDYTHKKVSRRLDRTGYRDATYHYFKFRYEGEKQENIYTYKLRETSKADKLEHQTVINLNKHFYIFWIQILFELENNSFLHKNNQLKLPIILDKILPLISEFPEIIDEPIIKLYTKIYYAYKEQLSENFSAIISGLKACESLMCPAKIHNLYLSTINYCICQANISGKRIWYSYLYNLLCWGIENKFIFGLNNRILSGKTYLSIVTICAKLYDLEESPEVAEEILSDLKLKIECLKDYLPNKMKDDFHKLALSIYYYFNGDYKLVVKNIVGTNLYSPSQHIKFRVPELISRFEMGDIDNLPIHIRSLIDFIKNQSNYTITHKLRIETIHGLKIFTKILYAKKPSELESIKTIVLQNPNNQGEIWNWLRKYVSRTLK